MSRPKKILLEIIIIILFFFLTIKAVELFTGVNPLNNLYERKNALDRISDVAAELTRQLDSGVEGRVTVYIKDIPDAELQRINFIMSNLNGSVDTYRLYTELFGVRRVDFEVVRSDNSYVYDAYKNGTSIPEDRVEAVRLLARVKRILTDNINTVMTEYQKELILHDYLIEHCNYGSGSAENENEFRAYGALVEGEAVCNGYAEAMALLLSCAGVENRYVVGVANSGSRSATGGTVAVEGVNNAQVENHAWNMVRVNGTWYHLDTTWDDPVGGGDVLSHAYFNLSDERMRRDHSWKQEKYEECPDMNWNYFYREHAYFERSTDMVAYVIEKLNFRPYAPVECAFAKFELTDTLIQEILAGSPVASITYSRVGDFSYMVLTVTPTQ